MLVQLFVEALTVENQQHSVPAALPVLQGPRRPVCGAMQGSQSASSGPNGRRAVLMPCLLPPQQGSITVRCASACCCFHASCVILHVCRHS